MKESKPYPIINEEDGSTQKANEAPCTPAYADAYDSAVIDCVPGLPETWEEFLDSLKEGEEELERGEFISWDVATKDIRKHIKEYAS